MSIASRHAYRFKYLQSEAWSTVRIEALAREDGKCEICGERSISNDAHHLWYPENIYKTTAHQLAVLCRPCHDFTHAMLPECKTKDENKGRMEWLRFKNAVKAWRHDKLVLFTNPEGIKFLNPVALLEEIKNVKALVNARHNAKKRISKMDFGNILAGLSRMASDAAEQDTRPAPHDELN